MNERQLEIYNNLIKLVQTNDAFFFQDNKRDNTTYRIFNYRLASYTDFLLPAALEARGIMFEIDELNMPVRLACRPMSKFFNLGECPLTMGVDLSMVESISTKSDGSLISTYMHDGLLCLKSKGALYSEQALDAMEWLNLPQHSKFKYTLMIYAIADHTVNLEWCSAKNRIVLSYETPQLIVLNVRSNVTGEYSNIGSMIMNDYSAPPVDMKGLTAEEFINQVPDMSDDIEGFVVKMRSGLWFKIKTNKYKSLHHCKDSVNNPRRLFEVIVDGGIDDIKDLFRDDKLLMTQIDDMEKKVNNIYNQMVQEVETFYTQHHRLDRKDYAILAKSSVTPLYFGHVMSLYLDKDINYSGWLKSKWKEFGLKDEALLLTAE